MSEKIAVILADGFEEIEAVVPSDILKRLGYEVILAGLASKTVTGSHGIRVNADAVLEELSADSLSAVFLPGGLPGATSLRDSDAVIALLRDLHARNRIVSAICAAPIALHKAGLCAGRRITGYPGSEAMAPGLVYTGERTETDGLIVTGKGPGAAFDFAFALAEALGTEKTKLQQLKMQMIVL